jgi:predicted nucleic acid-binding protein
MIVVDTNIMFAALVDSDWSAGARELYARDPDWRSDHHALVELSDVLVRYVRSRLLSAATATAVMIEIERRFGPGIVHSPQTAAMDVALAHGVSAYDARFLVVAATLELPVVTEDAKLRRAAPALTQSLREALRS